MVGRVADVVDGVWCAVSPVNGDLVTLRVRVAERDAVGVEPFGPDVICTSIERRAIVHIRQRDVGGDRGRSEADAV